MDITFDKLNLSDSTLNAIAAKNYKVASEIQAKIIPLIFEQKKDIIGIAQTGTGKTGAFGLPLVDLIDNNNKLPQAIILAPTRELALQVTNELSMFSGKKRLNILTVYGGAPMGAQIKSLKSGVDIVVGTPGRVVDLIKRKELKLNEARYFILDEADEMLKMGFIEDIELILDSSSKNRRVYLFSATMPDRIIKLSKKYMKNQIIIEVKKQLSTNNLIEHSFYKAKQSEKFSILSRLIDLEDFFYGIIFCRTKADVDNLALALKKEGHEVDSIHGDIAQNNREKILKKFRELKINILVATDVAARGIDVENLSHVINYNMPEDVETYTHRIGRTGRAGNKGKAVSIITPGEMRRISDIERVLNVKIQPSRIVSDREVTEIKDKRMEEELGKYVDKYEDDNHISLAKKLLEKRSPEKVVSALLSKLNEKRDNRNSSIMSNNNSNSKNNNNNNNNSRKEFNANDTTRLFIARGRIDNMDRKRLINFIEKETKVKIGKVDDVKVCEKFSFLTMNSLDASKVVEAFESKNSRRPLAEIAQN